MYLISACLDEARRAKRRAKSGADVQNRTGDLVLTKDALCQLSYVGVVRLVAPRHRLHLAPLVPAGWSGRRDSNPRRPAWKAGALPAELHPPVSVSLCISRMVGREGFEPSKPEGRQIYSLMRLAASLPPPGTRWRASPPYKSVFYRLFGCGPSVGAGEGN